MMSQFKNHPAITPNMKNNFANLTQLDAAMRGRLVVSCQPVDNGPLDVDSVVPLLAKAAQIGGAGAIRIEGATRVRASIYHIVARCVDVVGV